MNTSPPVVIAAATASPMPIRRRGNGLFPLDIGCVGFPQANQGCTQLWHHRRPRERGCLRARRRPRERLAGEEDQGGGQCNGRRRWMPSMEALVSHGGADSAVAEVHRHHCLLLWQVFLPAVHVDPIPKSEIVVACGSDAPMDHDRRIYKGTSRPLHCLPGVDTGRV